MILLLKTQQGFFEKNINSSILLSLISKDRLRDRDALCIFEDKILSKTLACWKFDKIPIFKHTLLDFVHSSNNTQISIDDFFYLATLCTTTNSANIHKLHDIYTLFELEENQKKLQLDTKRLNFPGGCLDTNICFLGEAPGYHEDTTKFNARVFSFGQTSMLFRLLSNKIFGPAWYTNIFKSAIKNNQKIQGELLNISLTFLKRELEILNIQNIICLGNYVYDCLKQKSIFNEYRIGKIYHPAFIFRSGNNILMYEKSMLTAKKELSCG